MCNVQYVQLENMFWVLIQGIAYFSVKFVLTLLTMRQYILSNIHRYCTFVNNLVEFNLIIYMQLILIDKYFLVVFKDNDI